MEFTGPIILGVAILAVVAFVGYQLLSRRDENLRPTKNDRDLLSLIRDLAEMYRATGR